MVVHSYRHRYALVPGDPAVAPIEERLAGQPDITVPTVSLDGDGDGVHPSRSKAQHAKKFSGPFDHQIIPRIGHNIPQEAPEAFAAAIQSLI